MSSLKSAELVVHEDTPDYAIASLSGIVFQMYRRSTPVGAARTASRVAEEVIAAGAEPRGLFIVTHEGATAPDSEARQILTRLGTRMKGARACAFVSLGSGFGASVMRSVMTGMVMLARPDFPVQVFSEVTAAVAWLGRQLEISEREKLRDALTQLGV